MRERAALHHRKRVAETGDKQTLFNIHKNLLAMKPIFLNFLIFCCTYRNLLKI